MRAKEIMMDGQFLPLTEVGMIAPVKKSVRQFEIYAMVALSHPIVSHGVRYPAGTVGQIVDTHGQHGAYEAYEVEFETPAYRVITIYGQDLIPK